MLSTLLSQVGSVLSKLFIFSSFVPTLIFTFLNGALLYFWHPGLHTWLAPQLTGPGVAFYFCTAIVAMAVFAYVLFTLNNSLRVILEQCTLLPIFLRNRFTASEQLRLQRLTNRYLDARNRRLSLDRLATKDDRLEKALDQGVQLGNKNTYDPQADRAGVELRALEQNLINNQVITPEQIDSAIDAFAVALSSNNLAFPSSDNPLQRQYGQLLSLIDDAARHSKFSEDELFYTWQNGFGPRSTRPTRLGNVAESLQGYGQVRYNLNLDVVWTRFFNALRENKDAFATIEDTKTQLDFLVACCWLSASTALGWSIALIILGHSLPAFLGAALLGPAVTYMLYRFAVRNYQVFADVVRTAIDQHRFRILESLYLPLPDGLRDERKVWETVEMLIGRGSQYLEISYRPSSGQPP